MPPLQYHAGQIAVQEEANTRELADHLAGWVGPVAEFAAQADVIVLALRGSDGSLQASVLSGPAPLAEVRGPSRLALLLPPPADLREGRVGGLVINFALLRRARINGSLTLAHGEALLDAHETFALCRKYIAPSLPTADVPHWGPAAREPVALDDPEIAALLARAETAFLLSDAPNGAPDVAHRGGPRGFVTYDPETRGLRWDELLGDGVFKSAGNVRATGRFTLFVPDMESGGGLELVCGDAGYQNVLTSRKRRLDPLVEHRDQFPVQGTIAATVERVARTPAALVPRRRIDRALRVTSCSSVDDQAPQ